MANLPQTCVDRLQFKSAEKDLSTALIKILGH